MVVRSIRTGTTLVLLCLGCTWHGCAGPYLLRRDPSGMPQFERAGLAWYLQTAIQNGHGRRKKTPWGQNYFEYYLKIIRTERPAGVPNAILHLGSHGTMDGKKYWNLGEAFVQEGYGEAACEAVLATARRWEQDRRSGKRVDGTNLELAYKIVLELKLRMYLHEHRDLAVELHSAHGHVVVKRELMIASMEGVHIDRVDGKAVQEALVPRLLAENDPVFSEAHQGLGRLLAPPRP